MNVELELISNVVQRGDMSGIRKLGLTPEHFQTEEGKTVFRWLWDQFHNPTTPGEVPDDVRLRRHFPSFDYRPSRNSIEALAQELLSIRVRADLVAMNTEMEQLLSDGEDPFLVLSAYLPKMRDLNSTGQGNDGLLLSQASSLLRREYETKELANGLTGIPYPWDPLNEATCGMQPEQFLVLYGRPKNMKSWVAIAMGAHAYDHNRRVLIYSRELAREDMLRRTASIICGVDYDLLRKAKLHPNRKEEFFEVLDALGQMETDTQDGPRKRSLLIVGDQDAKGGTVDGLVARAEKFGADLVIADGFYLMRDARATARTQDHMQTAHISRDLKRAAQYLRIPILGTTQANREANKSHGDDLSELSFSDAIGQDSDLIMRVFKGKGPTGKPAVLLTFPGGRETDVAPFVINANPGCDFSTLQRSVDVGAFLREKQRQDTEEAQKSAVANGTAPSPTGAAAPKRKPSPFRV